MSTRWHSMAIVLGFVAGCQNRSTEEIRPWQPSDHSNAGSGSAPTRPGAPPRQSTGEPRQTMDGLDEVSLATWRNNCTTCHGPLGRGDGPQAAIFQPKDLTDPEWHKATSDEQLLQSIQKGKNKMPGFALPARIALNLVKLVRLLPDTRGVATTPASTTVTTSTAAPAIPPRATATAPSSRPALPRTPGEPPP